MIASLTNQLRRLDVASLWNRVFLRHSRLRVVEKSGGDVRGACHARLMRIGLWNGGGDVDGGMIGGGLVSVNASASALVKDCYSCE